MKTNIPLVESIRGDCCKAFAPWMCLINVNCFYLWSCYYYYWTFSQTLAQNAFCLCKIIYQITLRDNFWPWTPCFHFTYPTTESWVRGEERVFTSWLCTSSRTLWPLWKISWLSHSVFRVTEKTVSHDEGFLFTGGRVVQGNYEPKVMKTYMAESPE